MNFHEFFESKLIVSNRPALALKWHFFSKSVRNIHSNDPWYSYNAHRTYFHWPSGIIRFTSRNKAPECSTRGNGHRFHSHIPGLTNHYGVGILPPSPYPTQSPPPSFKIKRSSLVTFSRDNLHDFTFRTLKNTYCPLANSARANMVYWCFSPDHPSGTCPTKAMTLFLGMGVCHLSFRAQ